ncbi:hypothetical protein GCM10020227_28790 [Streptomyces flavovirens]
MGEADAVGDVSATVFASCPAPPPPHPARASARTAAPADIRSGPFVMVDLMCPPRRVRTFCAAEDVMLAVVAGCGGGLAGKEAES